MRAERKRILILCKTYPSPSAKYVETSCVAGALEDGTLVRLYPVPFRLVGDNQKFKKWQWIDVIVQKSRNDRRPESHKVFVDTIDCRMPPLSTKNHWAERRSIIDKIWAFDDFDYLEAARSERGITLGLLRPAKILRLDITPAEHPDWTDDEKAKLAQLQRQGGLFEDGEVQIANTLRKLPFNFHYVYRCAFGGLEKEYRHKIVDWEIGALYWNTVKSHGVEWEAPFRSKVEGKLPSSDLMFLMGTIHRFPSQWLIISVIYPPRQPREALLQGTLF